MKLGVKSCGMSVEGILGRASEKTEKPQYFRSGDDVLEKRDSEVLLAYAKNPSSPLTINDYSEKVLERCHAGSRCLTRCWKERVDDDVPDKVELGLPRTSGGRSTRFLVIAVRFLPESALNSAQRKTNFEYSAQSGQIWAGK